MKINDTVLGPGDTEGCKTIFLTLRSSVLKETHTHRHTHTHRLFQCMRVIHGVIKNYKLRRKKARQMIFRKVIVEIIFQGNAHLNKISLGLLPKFQFLQKLILTPDILGIGNLFGR